MTRSILQPLLSSFKQWKIQWGKIPLCNRKKERAPQIGNFVFPLCWRCTGSIIGGISGIFCLNVLFPEIYKLISKNHLVILAIVLMLPSFIDGTLQYWGKIESTNLRRLITGVAFGKGAVLLSYFLAFSGIFK